MRNRVFLLVAVLLVVVLGGVGAVYAYDSSQSGRIGKGVTVARIDVSGLTAGQAKARLRRLYVADLRRPVTVRWQGRAYRLSGREAGVTTNLGATVQSALARSRRGNIISRTARNLSGGSLDVALRPQVSYSTRAVRRLVARIASDVDQSAKEADVSFSVSGPSVTPGHDGRTLRRAPLMRSLRAAFVGSGPRSLRARTLVVRPHRSTADVARRYPVVLALDRSAFRLTLYRDFKPAKTYTVAVGKVGLETPAGLYHIQNKAVDPAWHVPNSAWAGSLAGQVIPGGAANNPLKARWLGIFDGAGIHGTDVSSSLGSAASHGCVRMSIPDVEELYSQVSVGAPIYIG